MTRAKPARRFGVTFRPGDERRLHFGRMAVERLAGKADLVAPPDVADLLGVPSVPLPKMDVDVLLVVGGDGAILHALQSCHAPVFGINAGEIGFLTEVEPIELGDGIQRLLDGEYFLESRLKLATWINGERLPDTANDTVVKTPRPSKILNFDIRTPAGLRTDLRADGLVFATPTGSTSYAMSAGGPIIDPAVEAFLVVPIAPFSLHSRPIVVPPSTTIETRLVDKAKTAAIVLDGQVEREMQPSDILRVGVSEHKARFARFRPHFWTRLAERLR